MPKFQTNQTIFYSWEGNPVNISCDVKSNPPATMLWRRERLTISAEGTANIRVHTIDGKSLLEVGIGSKRAPTGNSLTSEIKIMATLSSLASKWSIQLLSSPLQSLGHCQLTW